MRLSSERLPSSGGIGPVRRLRLTSSFQRLGPPPRYRVSSAESLPSSGGIGPVSSLPSRNMRPSSREVAKLGRARTRQAIAAHVQPPKAGEPAKLRRDRAGSAGCHGAPGASSLASPPISGGNRPASPFSGSSSLVTRPSRSTRTPCHCASGASVSQFSLFVQFGPSVASYSATKASRSREESALRACTFVLRNPVQPLLERTGGRHAQLGVRVPEFAQRKPRQRLRQPP